MRKYLFLIAISFSVTFLGCDAGEQSPEPTQPPDTTSTNPLETHYKNPVVTPISADPSIIHADSTYYLYATMDNWANGDGFHIIPIFKSHDLVNWVHVGDAFSRTPAWTNQPYLWAPDISKFKDTYYLYYALAGKNNPCIGLATSKYPEGPWDDLGRAVFCSDDVGVSNSIDPFVWNDGENRTIVWGSFKGIYALKLNEEGTAPATDNPSNAKVKLANNRYEGAYIFHHKNYYYLFVSAGTCCNGINSTYQVYVGRSDSLLGPYADAQGKDLRSGGGTLILSGNNTYVGPGHNSIATDDAGHDWLVYHAIPRSKPRLSTGVNHRQGLIDRIKWEDGWPVINDGDGPSTQLQPKPVIK